MANRNVLSGRYATDEINNIFSPEGTVRAERDLWIAVMKAQRELGLDIPSEDIEKFERAKDDIKLDRIREIEKKTRHDVKGKIEAFVEVAGAKEHIHRGMTSRDLTDNVEQMQIKNAAKIIFGKNISILRHMLEKAQEYEDIVLTGRTHHQAAQTTTLGRRMAMYAEELQYHLTQFEHFINTYPLRGVKGPVGTQFDMLTLLGDRDKVLALEQKIAGLLGFSKVLDAPGQVYPRSLDHALLARLAGLTAACRSYATTMRLMAGYELVTEGFKEGQVGSSAMPHKMNTRSSERIYGLANLVQMYADGASRLSGDQWEEGDVSCSVQRRIIIPDAFYASDGLCETILTVLNEMGPFTDVIGKEVDRYLPFMASTEILSLATQKGIGREAAHELIKRHAVNEALRMRNGYMPQIAERLAEEAVFKQAGITKDDITALLKDREHFIGLAKDQIAHVSASAGLFGEGLLTKYAEQAKYEPKQIL
jgi:adenylosuccinate lyase